MVRTAALLGALWLALPAAAEPYAVGSVLPALELADQHGESHQLDASVRLLLFSRGMDGGGVIKEVLADDGAAFLERHGAVYVADVSGMPGLVRRLMAVPAMRRRPYAMWLDVKGDATADFPAEAGRATLLFVDALRVVRIEYAESPASLRAAVEPKGEEPRGGD